MIYPVKVLDRNGKLQEEKCMTGQEALGHYWINKVGKNNNEIFALSAPEKIAWKRMTKEEKIVPVKKWTYHRPHQKARPQIFEITCQNKECGKVVMKTMARAKYCSISCQISQSRKNLYKKKQIQKREQQNETERKGIQK